MTKLISLAGSLFVTTLMVGCIGDNIEPEEVPLTPETCAQIGHADRTAHDGVYTLYVGGDETKPWKAYCIDMQSGAKEYLTLGGSWSQYTAGGSANGTTVRTTYDKARIDPETLQLDPSDQTFAISDGTLTDVTGVTVTSMPLGAAMTCGGGYSTAQVHLGDAPFHVAAAQFVAGGDPGFTGHASAWATDKTVEMLVDGACGWILPDGPASARPMNTAGAPIQLTYAP